MYIWPPPLNGKNEKKKEKQAGAELGQAQVKQEVVDEVLAEAQLKLQLQLQWKLRSGGLVCQMKIRLFSTQVEVEVEDYVELGNYISQAQP